MESNVSGVDLEELKKAREELDAELGVETDPKMYDDYNPNRAADDSSRETSVELENQSVSDAAESEESKENESSENITAEAETSIDVEEDVDDSKNASSTENLQKYDIFSAFEVNNGVSSAKNEPAEEPKTEETKSEKIEDFDEKKEPENDSKNDDDTIDNIEELESLLNGILENIDELDDEKEDDESEEETAKTDTTVAQTVDEENQQSNENGGEDFISLERNDFNSEKTSTQNEVSLEQETESLDKEIADKNTMLELDDQEETEDVDSEQEKKDFELSEEPVADNRGVVDVNSMLEDENDNADQEEPAAVQTETASQPAPVTLQNEMPAETNGNNTEVITDYNQLKEMLQKELAETEKQEQEKLEEQTEQEPVVGYAEIEPCKFMDIIVGDNFKGTDRVSYLIGKNEFDSEVYGNFKEHHNLAVFGKNKEVTDMFLNSMILSLCLKNSYQEINFILLDSNVNSKFEVYNKSSYLFFNRIAKTNKEVLDTLIEVTKEIDERYNKFADLEFKSIDQYNTMAKEIGSELMPHIVVVFNNYTKASQGTEKDDINSCLYQILKFGRLVGVNVVVVSMTPIMVGQINYNLSSRISFKSDDDSRFTVGVEGAQYLPEDDDGLYFNIATEKVEHFKLAQLSENELDLIISDLED